MHISKNKTNPAFTLVELIVVIVILAILATIAFLSFSSQSSSARDSTRLSDLSNLAKGIGVFSATAGKYPMPDKAVQIINGILGPIGYQGEAGDGVTRIIKASKDGMKDPLEKSNYTYATNVAGNKYRLMAFLENKDSLVLNLFGDEVSATDYVTKYPYLKGDNMAIIVETSSGGILTPLQDTGTGIDVTAVSTDSGIIAYTSNITEPVVVGPEIALSYSSNSGSQNNEALGVKSISDCGTLAGEVIYGTADGTDAGLTCNDNIIVCTGAAGNGYTLAACNVGATTPYSNQTFALTSSPRNATINSWAGGLYQWGRNDEVSMGTHSVTPFNGILPATGLLGNNTLYQGYLNGDWLESEAGVATTTRWAASAMKGPCNAGYHVPTYEEWKGIWDSGNGTEWSGDTVGTIFSDKIKLPFAGYRNPNDGLMGGQIDVAYYWTSTYTPGGSYTFNIGPDGGDAESISAISAGMSVRCIKD